MDTNFEYAGATDGRDLARTVRMKLHTVMSASRTQAQAFARQAGIGATPVAALAEIARQPGIRIGELARLSGIKTSTASNLVDKLEARGLLRRKRDTHDQRIVRLFLTAEGSAILERVPPPTGGALATALGLVSPESLAALDRALEQLIGHLQEGDADYLSGGDLPEFLDSARTRG